MKFSVGYQLRADDMLVSAVNEYADKISEIYFAWEDFPNGRNTDLDPDINRYEARKKQEEDLRELSGKGISFNLLLNGNCYGKDAQSRAFFCKTGDTLEYLIKIYNLKTVTTTSPLIAKFIKDNFEGLEVRASVNMGIENIYGMAYIAELFDSYYLKREYNRDLDKLTQAKEWCDKNGKKLYGLANSGCLNFCSAHTFHDNLVSHEHEIAKMDNAYAFEGQCRVYLKTEEKRKDWLKISNFIRPEDTGFYEGYFESLKLATRVNRNPKKVISAYCNTHYSGAVTDLLEPNLGDLFYPFVVENKKIDPEFNKKIISCDKRCESCGYCDKVLDNALTALD